MSFPIHRPRRLRSSLAWRRAVREHDLDARRLFLPLFVGRGEDVCDDVVSMPGVELRSVDRTVELAAAAAEAGVGGVILFGIPEHKDPQGSSGWDPEGPVPSALRVLREQVPDLLLWADVCLCEYTDHGHCGLLTPDGRVDNDASLPLLSRAALAYAEAGAHAVAPSDMMDGRIGRIREDLDAAGRDDVVVVSLSLIHI